MNMIAMDIGNTNVTTGLFIDDAEKFIKKTPVAETDELAEILTEAWEQIPFVEIAKEEKRNGVIVVSSVNSEAVKAVEDICKNKFDEKIKLIGRDVPLPIEMGVENSSEVGTDRVVAAAAAYAVVEDAVVIADFGTAITIDLVDEQGTFLGGIIAPGFSIAADALNIRTDKLPKLDVQVTPPKNFAGGNTLEAINNGLYFSAVGLLRTVVEKYAEDLEGWPQVVVTGGAAGVLKQDCDFVDSWVTNLPVRGVVLAYKKFIEEKIE